MTQLTIDQLYDQLVKASAAVVASEREHTPMIIVAHESGRITPIVVASDMKDGVTKDALAHFHRTRVQLPGAVAAVLIMEAWTLNLKSDAIDPAMLERIRQGGMQISECPQRQEAIVFSILTPTRQGFAQCLIDRKDNSLVKGELTWVGENGYHLEGRFVRDGKDSPTAH